MRAVTLQWLHSLLVGCSDSAYHALVSLPGELMKIAIESMCTRSDRKSLVLVVASMLTVGCRVTFSQVSPPVIANGELYLGSYSPE